jgi:hypothetical protein
MLKKNVFRVVVAGSLFLSSGFCHAMGGEAGTSQLKKEKEPAHSAAVTGSELGAAGPVAGPTVPRTELRSLSQHRVDFGRLEKHLQNLVFFAEAGCFFDRFVQRLCSVVAAVENVPAPQEFLCLDSAVIEAARNAIANGDKELLDSLGLQDDKIAQYLKISLSVCKLKKMFPSVVVSSAPSSVDMTMLYHESLAALDNEQHLCSCIEALDAVVPDARCARLQGMSLPAPTRHATVPEPLFVGQVDGADMGNGFVTNINARVAPASQSSNEEAMLAFVQEIIRDGESSGNASGLRGLLLSGQLSSSACRMVGDAINRINALVADSLMQGESLQNVEKTCNYHSYSVEKQQEVQAALARLRAREQQESQNQRPSDRVASLKQLTQDKVDKL